MGNDSLHLAFMAEMHLLPLVNMITRLLTKVGTSKWISVLAIAF